MGRSNVQGTIYLVHFDRPLHHARHYLGWSENVDSRIVRHEAGRGSRIMRAVVQAGIDFRVCILVSRNARRRAEDEEAAERSSLLPNLPREPP